MFSNRRLFIVTTSFIFSQGAFAAPKTSPVAKKQQPAQTSTASINKVATAKLKLPFPDSSLWFRYYQAGEDASLAKHDDVAKKYWMASLAELEKHPPAKDSDTFLSVKLSALEAGLMNLYPNDWSKEKGDRTEILEKRKEHVALLSRIANINTFYAPPNDLFRTKANERYATAKQAYDKAVAEAKQSPSAPKTETD